MTVAMNKLSPAGKLVAKTVAALIVDQVLADPESGLSKSAHKTLRGRNRKLKQEIKSDRASKTA